MNLPRIPIEDASRLLAEKCRKIDPNSFVGIGEIGGYGVLYVYVGKRTSCKDIGTKFKGYAVEIRRTGKVRALEAAR